jgi:hypothetical protein
MHIALRWLHHAHRSSVLPATLQVAYLCFIGKDRLYPKHCRQYSLSKRVMQPAQRLTAHPGPNLVVVFLYFSIPFVRADEEPVAPRYARLGPPPAETQKPAY